MNFLLDENLFFPTCWQQDIFVEARAIASVALKKPTGLRGGLQTSGVQIQTQADLRNPGEADKGRVAELPKNLLGREGLEPQDHLKMTFCSFLFLYTLFQ